MTTNWEKLRKELNETEEKGKGNSKKRKRKVSENCNNKWKKMREEIEKSDQQKPEKAIETTISAKKILMAIDCEYVGVGLSGAENMLARVSIVDAEGIAVYDKYVKPTEEVVDYRTKVSGIRPGHLLRGVPFVQVQSEVRKLLSDNILIGHSLRNDLTVLGLTHPPKLIRDTAKFKLLRETLDDSKKTPSLKLLAHNLLGVQIQQGEHDSIVDAKIALRIYLKYREKWERTLKKGGKK
ncbi:hypothetical protein niasHT_034582 [Heterodera trifolii]|uniref:RNA exonuclease 4 n=1 Tax=Heterodera trifolii TaxID=157864 RepID=A0ABD2IIQ8_9BILA